MGLHCDVCLVTARKKVAIVSEFAVWQLKFSKKDQFFIYSVSHAVLVNNCFSDIKM